MACYFKSLETSDLNKRYNANNQRAERVGENCGVWVCDRTSGVSSVDNHALRAYPLILSPGLVHREIIVKSGYFPGMV